MWLLYELRYWRLINDTFPISRGHFLSKLIKTDAHGSSVRARCERLSWVRSVTQVLYSLMLCYEQQRGILYRDISIICSIALCALQCEYARGSHLKVVDCTWGCRNDDPRCRWRLDGDCRGIACISCDGDALVATALFTVADCTRGCHDSPRCSRRLGRDRSDCIPIPGWYSFIYNFFAQ